MKNNLLSATILCYLVFNLNLFAEHRTFVLVEKSKKILKVIKDNQTIFEFPISLGFEPVGQKLEEGDGKTPEGIYTIDYQIAEWDYYKALHISYPNKLQIENAKLQGKNPGGGILIHGMKYYWNWFGHFHTYLNWTNGCIAVNNEEMDVLLNLVPIGSKIIIKP